MKAIVKRIPFPQYTWSREMAIVLVPENENDETLLTEIVDEDSKFSCAIHSEDTFAAEVSKRRVQALEQRKIIEEVQEKREEVQDGNSEG
jgi:hypothetical protein